MKHIENINYFKISNKITYLFWKFYKKSEYKFKEYEKDFYKFFFFKKDLNIFFKDINFEKFRYIFEKL